MRHLIAGLILLALGAWGIITWWDEFGDVLRGVIPFLLAVVGLAAIGSGFQRTMDEARQQEESLIEQGAGPSSRSEE